MNDISEETKNEIRRGLVIQAEKLIDIPYKMGAEWTDFSKLPKELDCSELVEGVYRIMKLQIPDGSQNQFNFTIATETPKIGDLCFFGRDKDITKIYHVGILYSDKEIIEARDFDGRDWTGKVILRERKAWENWKNFCGYRSHPKLV